MRTRIVYCLALLICVLPVQAEEGIGSSLKKMFASPTPTPHKKHQTRAKTSPSPSASPKKKKKTSPTATPSETAAPEKSPSKSKRRRNASPTPTETPSPTITPEVSGGSTPLPSASPEKENRDGRTASLSADAIRDYQKYSPRVKKLVDSALELTTRNLTYKYGSADPANGGMDCSGFVYYIFRQNGIEDVPRDSSEQYVWLRRAGKVEPVVSRKEDSFELENLRPGDLLFWTGTYALERDPPITHAMIYLGRERKSGKRVMVGSSDGRTYEGKQRFGVSVFDFKMPRESKDGAGMQPAFIGYGHVPGLND